jgi:hypothetical protein
MDDDIFSDLESTLSATPATTVLDLVEVQLGLAGNAPTPNEEGNEDGIIIPYWRGVESKWPELARFAYDALSIPAMSTECERCFSSSKKTIETRWALNADSIEACECQGHWIRRRFA